MNMKLPRASGKKPSIPTIVRPSLAQTRELIGDLLGDDSEPSVISSGMNQTSSMFDIGGGLDSREFFRNKSLDNDDNSETASVKFRLKQETAKVRKSRTVVRVCLLLMAITVTVATYVYVTQRNNQEFQNRYKEITNLLREAFLFSARNSILGMNTFADIITAHALSSNSSWPFVTVPFFHIHAENALKETNGELITFYPLVYERDRSAWNYYSVKYQGWVHEGSQRSTTITTAETEEEETSITPYIFAFNNESQRVPEIGKDVCAPMWQMYPPPPTLPGYVNLNFLSVDIGKSFLLEQPQAEEEEEDNTSRQSNYTFNNYLDKTSAIDSSPKITMSRIYMNETFFVDNGMSNELITAFLRPLYKGFTYPSRMVGLVGLKFSWDTFLNNLLPESADGLYIVIENTCNQTYTYSAYGTEAIFVGEGDLHEPEYDSFVTSFEFLNETLLQTEENATTTSSSTNNSTTQNPSCTYWIHLYPSDRLRNGERATDRDVLTGFAFMVFIVIGITFCVYDRYVRKRNKKIMKQAATSNKVLADIYPKMIRDRLLYRENIEESSEQHISTRGGGVGGGGGGGVSKEHTLGSSSGAREFSMGEIYADMSSRSLAPTGLVKVQGGERTIADLYPETTILFSDIVGFTAWSSVREPTQVFELLEALFQSFDEIAELRRVFKVETVGDCYVAATGLPEPRRDHAVVMVKFARDCLYTMKELFRELEVTLGPETSDLSMRFGLHSGSITAGVLRGKGARFQLFGDTMNTASRIETTGMKGRIHISQATADLLVEAGKGNWIIQREDKVVAKGKGEMTTYWLHLKRDEGETMSSTSGSSDENNNSGGVSLKKERSVDIEMDEDDEDETYSEVIDDDEIIKMMPTALLRGSSQGSDSRSGQSESRRNVLLRRSYCDKRVSLTIRNSNMDKRMMFRRSSQVAPSLEVSVEKSLGADVLSPKMLRLIDWMVDVLCRILVEIENSPYVVASSSPSSPSSPPASLLLGSASARPFSPHSLSSPNMMKRSFTTDDYNHDSSISLDEDFAVSVEEVKEAIKFPEFNGEAKKRCRISNLDGTGRIRQPIVKQLREYVTEIASKYKNSNPFHNFEHACHVAMSVIKLLARLVSLDAIGSLPEEMAKQMMHMNTFGISSDPLAQFAAVFAALIHDVDHPGLENEQLVLMKTKNALRYKNKCISEQNSLDVAWKLLMEDRFSDLKDTISSSSPSELRRFRQILVNSLMATDLHDKEMNDKRDRRWEKVFTEQCGKLQRKSYHPGNNDDTNMKATLTLEYLIQASDLSHMMQHWHIYRKWNGLLFEERYFAFKNERGDRDPAEYWYKDELDFFDQVVIPICEKMKTCRVFGVAAGELLSYAKENRKEWEQRGSGEVEQMIKTAKEKYSKKAGSSLNSSFHDSSLHSSFVNTTSLLVRSLHATASIRDDTETESSHGHSFSHVDASLREADPPLRESFNHSHAQDTFLNKRSSLGAFSLGGADDSSSSFVSDQLLDAC